jgi:hypothetical protein
MPHVDITVTSGTTYHIAVDGFDGAVGNINLTMADLGGTVSLPSGAVGIADFVNLGFNWSGGSTANLADVIDHPEYVVPGTGLVLNDVNPPQFIGDFATYLLAGDWTVVMEWYRQTTLCDPLHIQDITDNDPRLSCEDSSGGEHFFAYDLVGGSERDTNSAASGGADHVVNVVALTRTNAKLVQSFNGSSIQSAVAAQASWAAGVTNVYTGGSVGSNFGPMILGRIVVYPPQSDAALPGLSVASVISIPTAAPANDSFANAIALSLGVQVTGSNKVYYSDFDVTVPATQESGEPDHAGSGLTTSIWYKFTAPATGNYRASTAGSVAPADDTVLAVYTGSAVNALTLVGQNDDVSGSVFTSAVTFAATSGVTYYIAVDSYMTGTIAIEISNA